ncbi:MAG TPA: TlpA disulfide reductase family protein [Ferruginibacter sp.]|nr:TlpA disulfide reductase family protein [Ferruginibacter sp.]
MKKVFLFMIVLLVAATSSAQLKLGDTVPEISLPGTDGNMIKLSSLAEKVVLVDFWASWCAPCRAANPFVQKLYKKYGKNGFEVYAVSLDVKKEAWLKAIKKDKLTYSLVIDTDGWKSKVAESYFVDQLPTNFLLDRKGKIVAINIEGKEMFDTVKKLVE